MRVSSYAGKEYSDEVKQDKKKIGGYRKKVKVKLDKVRKRLNQPLIKGGRRTSLGGGRVRVSTSAGIRGFFK